jgi:hypothetical protein
MRRQDAKTRHASIPSLVVTRPEIDRMVAIADEALTEAEARFAGEIEGAS